MNLKTNPFPGIRNFEPDEHELFFGRETEIKDILKILNTKNFVAVIGSSGSGKSSLIKAGAIPKLQLSESGKQWKKFDFRPGDHPIDSLSTAMCSELEHYGYTFKDIRNQILKEDKSVVDILQLHPQFGDYKWLIYIDQFEEIFRYETKNEYLPHFEETRRFVESILKSVEKLNNSVYIVISIRYDFLGDCTNFVGLVETINQGSYLIPRMTEKGIIRAIQGPIQKCGVNITESLVDRLMKDCGESPDQLLIMQHALMRTWDYWKENHLSENPIEIHHYEAIGGMRHALSVHGEQIYTVLQDQRTKLIAERIFKSLTNAALDNRGTRNPSSFKTLTVLTAADESEVRQVIDQFRAFGNSFLTPHYTIPIENDTMIDISHESIMRVWDRARQWVNEESKSVELYLRLCRSSELYQMGKTGLWVNPDLDLGMKWYAQNKPNKTWALRYDPAFERAITFLEYSRNEYEKQLKNKENQQRRKLAFARNFAIFLGVASILSILFLIVALNLRFKAEESEKKALDKEKIAISASLTAEEKTLDAITNGKIAEQQQMLAEQQKLIAEDQKKFAIVQQEIAINEKLVADKAKEEAQERRIVAEEAMKIAKLEKAKADSMRIIAVSEKFISDRLKILAISKSIAIKSKEMFKTGNEQNGVAALLAVQSYLFAKQQKGVLFDPDIYDALSAAANQTTVLLGHNARIRFIEIIDNQRFVSAGEDGSLKIWTFGNNTPGFQFKMKGDPRSITYFSGNKSLYASTLDGRLYTIDLSVNQSEPKLIVKKGLPIAAISANSKGVLAIGYQTGKLDILETTNVGTDTTEFKLPNKINTLQIGNKGKMMAIALESGEIYIYFLDNLKIAAKVLKPSNKSLTALSFSSNDQFLAVADEANDVKVWSFSDNKWITVNLRHSSRINALSFNPKKTYIASCSYDGTIKIINYLNPNDDPIIIRNQEDWIFDIQFTEDGKKLISCGNDKTIRIWAIDLDYLIASIKLNRNMTTEEWNKYIGQDVNYQKTNPNL